MDTINKISTTVRNIGQKTFSGLVSEAICETGNDLDVVGFKSSRGPFQISFYANIEDNYQVVVEDFGMNLQGGGWEIMEPTDSQIEKMQNIILSRVDEINESKLQVIEYQENHGIYSQYY